MKIGIRAVVYNQKMRDARKKLGLTVIEFAKKTSISVHTIQNVETMHRFTNELSKAMNILEIIATELNCDFDDLFPPEYIYAVEHNRLPSTNRRNYLIRDIPDLCFTDAKTLYLESPEKEIEENAMKESIRKEVDKLPSRMAMIIKYHHGFIDNEEHTLEDTGRKFGITRERVRQIIIQAYRILRSPTTGNDLQDYLDV